jgi:hypothetical protein
MDCEVRHVQLFSEKLPRAAKVILRPDGPILCDVVPNIQVHLNRAFDRTRRIIILDDLAAESLPRMLLRTVHDWSDEGFGPVVPCQSARVLSQSRIFCFLLHQQASMCRKQAPQQQVFSRHLAREPLRICV